MYWGVAMGLLCSLCHWEMLRDGTMIMNSLTVMRL